jgi:predicted DNA-binding WGR domain protein
VAVDGKGEPLELYLKQYEPSKNTDKFYNVQVVKQGAEYHFISHWGRTGAKGQSQTDGPFVGAAGMQQCVDLMEERFKAKTSFAFADRSKAAAAPKAGKYAWVKKNYKQATQAKGKGGVVMWQYYIGDGVDGKANAWYDYDPDNSEHVETAGVERVANPWMAIRTFISESSGFEYQVDFDAMTQKNTRTGKVRQVRRTVNGICQK